MDITHDNVCSSMLSCFYSHLLSTGRPISSLMNLLISLALTWCWHHLQNIKNGYWGFYLLLTDMMKVNREHACAIIYKWKCLLRYIIKCENIIFAQYKVKMSLDQCIYIFPFVLF